MAGTWSWIISTGRFEKGENWAVLGPNGAGKSKLLELITGDNVQGYANEIHLFGRRKEAARRSGK